MLHLFLEVITLDVYSDEVELACGETTYCYLSESNLIIQPAYNKETNKPTTDTDLALKYIKIDQSISLPQSIYLCINANPYPNDEVQHKFVAIDNNAFAMMENNFYQITIPETVTSISDNAFMYC